MAQAVALHRQGQIADAESIYLRLLEDDPHNGTARHLLGLIRYDQKRFAEALDLIGPVAAANPRDIEAQSNLGNVLKALGRHDQALASYDRALAINPSHSIVLNNRGLVLTDLRRFEEALASYDRALARDSRNAEALFNRGLTLWHLQRFEDALSSYDRSIAAFPGYARAWNNRGNVLRQLNRPVEALESYEKAYALDRTNAYALGNIAFLAEYLCDWNKVEKIGNEITVQIRAGSAVVSPFVLLGYSSDPALQLQCAAAYSRDRLPARPPPMWTGESYRHARIRVAYMSSDFRQHPMSYLIVGMLESHDRSRFEVIGISLSPDDGSDIRKRVVQSCDQFEDVWSLSDEAVARRLRALEVDILVDLNGYTEGCRPEILGYRPSPVQVGYLGYPATTGTALTDYIIADETTLPLEHQSYFCEKIVHLPDCYLVNDAKRAVSSQQPARPDEGLPENGFVFCCFSNGWKITAGIFDIWMRLLSAVPDSVLWLIDSNQAASAHLKRQAAQRGVAPERIIIARRLTPQAHLARHGLADLALDTQPYNGHTTACDALWMGVPLVAMRGDSFTGRVAASILAAVGLPDLVADSPSDYEALALALARNPARLAALRERLQQNRATFPLFDTNRFTRHIEAAYTQMHHWAASGDGPRSFRVARVNI